MNDLPASGNRYDDIPYPNLAHVHAHPRLLETMATLFGMQPPSIVHCRVLELGSAAGGNLIPQAQDLPRASFLGIDLSERQVREGQTTIQRLGLRNIELRHADIMDVNEDWGQFDYILCHGVLSWVPPEVQEKIFQICQRNLGAQGVAIISFNTYPGWHQVNAIRDMLRYHIRQFRTPGEQIEQAKALLDLLASSPDTHPLLRNVVEEEIALVTRANFNAYFFHDHLEGCNYPLYFHEFIGQASQHGLQYLADTTLSSMFIKNCSPAVQEVLQQFPMLEAEQYLDFLRNRRFRSTLVCHAGVALNRNLTPDRMKQFHVGLTRSLDSVPSDLESSEPIEFKIPGAMLKVTNPLIRAAMIHLHEVFPRQIAFDELYLATLARLGSMHQTLPKDDRTEESLAASLLMGFSVGFISPCVHPPQYVLQPGRRPVAPPLVRLQAETANSVTNQRHEQIELAPIERFVVLRLDGKHDHGALVRDVQQAVRNGTLNCQVGEESVRKVDPKIISQAVDMAVQTLSARALLIG